MSETTVHVEAVSIVGDGVEYTVNGSVESVTIPAARMKAIADELADLRERVGELEGELEYIRDLARTGLPPAGYSGENWAQHKLIRIAAKSDRALAEGGE